MRFSTLLLAGAAAVHGAITPQGLVSTLDYWGKYSNTSAKMTERFPSHVDRQGLRYNFVLNTFKKILNDTVELSKQEAGSSPFTDDESADVLSHYLDFAHSHVILLHALNAKEEVWRGNKDIEEDIWSSVYGDGKTLDWFATILRKLLSDSTIFDLATEQVDGEIQASVIKWKAGDPRGDSEL